MFVTERKIASIFSIYQGLVKEDIITTYFFVLKNG